ncbi:MAG: glycosyltransferase [Defluviitaleaceae bacterium]|nr:glycosyltransferase [Defluviitaleaceae bacterium]
MPQKEQPLISVIVPVYNVAEYLSRCINSILDQSYQMLEIILVNDGSTDESGTICNNFSEEDNRIKVIHQENAGVSAARNAGLDVAQGEWIGFVDPDDWIEPDIFEKLHQAAMQNVKQVAICGYIKHCANGWTDNRTCPEIAMVVPHINVLEYVLDEEHFGGFIWNKLFAGSLINNENNKIRFRNEFHVCQDLVFVIEALLNSSDVAYISEPLYHYCLREGSTTESFGVKRLTELDAWEHVLTEVSSVSNELEQLAQFRLAGSAIGLIRDAVAFDGEAYIPPLQKKAKTYAKSYLLYGKTDLRMKFRGMAIMLFPKSSYKVWQMIKKQYNITWWYKELKGDHL